MKKSNLVNGNIPAYTECPYHEDCEMYVNNKCYHDGLDHTCEYSCSIARALDMCHLGRM